MTHAFNDLPADRTIRNGIVVRPASGPASRTCTVCGWPAPIVDREGVCTACAIRADERAVCEREAPRLEASPSGMIHDRGRGPLTADDVRAIERAGRRPTTPEEIAAAATSPAALMAAVQRRPEADDELRKLRAQVATLTAERDAYVSNATQLRSLARLVAAQGEEQDRQARVIEELRAALTATQIVLSDVINNQPDTP